MSARSIYNYNTDLKLKSLIDNQTVTLVSQIQTDYDMTGPSEILSEVMKFFLIHGTFIVTKTYVNSQPTFTVLHPELDDVKLNMEPTPRLTLTRYLPLSQKEDLLVIGEDNFRVYEGALADINMLSLLKFLGYTTSEISPS